MPSLLQKFSEVKEKTQNAALTAIYYGFIPLVLVLGIRSVKNTAGFE